VHTTRFPRELSTQLAPKPAPQKRTKVQANLVYKEGNIFQSYWQRESEPGESKTHYRHAGMYADRGLKWLGKSKRKTSFDPVPIRNKKKPIRARDTWSTPYDKLIKKPARLVKTTLEEKTKQVAAMGFNIADFLSNASTIFEEHIQRNVNDYDFDPLETNSDWEDDQVDSIFCEAPFVAKESITFDIRRDTAGKVRCTIKGRKLASWDQKWTQHRENLLYEPVPIAFLVPDPDWPACKEYRIVRFPAIERGDNEAVRHRVRRYLALFEDNSDTQLVKFYNWVSGIIHSVDQTELSFVPTVGSLFCNPDHGLADRLETLLK
jgi:hypothetical protein